MAERKILHSWKDIANHVGRAVRTLQRWEETMGLPVHRPSGKDRSAVFAFEDEIDEWLARADVRGRPYVRPILIVLDPPLIDNISNRKLSLELAKFNVVTAFTEDEVLATARRIDVDAFLISYETEEDRPLCETLKELYPRKPLFIVTERDDAPQCADHVIRSKEVPPLMECVLEVLGRPKLVE